MINKSLMILWIVVLSLNGFSQDAATLLAPTLEKWNQIKDYRAQVQITSHIPLIKSFPVKVDIFFKQKNKFKMVAKGIAILPKQQLNELPIFLNQTNKYTALLTGEEIIDGSTTKIITVLPKEDNGDLILLKLWIDVKKSLLIKSQNTTRSNGTITGLYQYNTQSKFGLPDQLTFIVDVNKFKIPKGLATDINRSSKPSEKDPPSKEGKIILTFKNYQVNSGIDDAIFKS